MNPKQSKIEKREIQIPRQLQKESFGFVKLKPKSKLPFEREWQKNPHDLRKINQWVKQGNNYGVVGGYGGLIIIDADAAVIKELIEAKLPPTFTIKSRGDKRHFYYLCPEIKSKIVFNDKIEPAGFLEGEDHYGEIISFGSQVVGPGSIHPETNNPYEIINDIEISNISKEDVYSALAEYLPHAFEKKDYKIEKNIDLNVFDILSKFGVSPEYNGRQLQISHPIHGSDNGGNFVVSQEKNVWHCFRHGSGGGAMGLIAVLEGITDCAQAIPGGLRGKNFIKTKEIAREKYGLKRESKKAEVQPEESPRVKKIEKIEREVSFTDWREIINDNFPGLLFPAEVGLSIIAQILIKEITNPFALVLVDVPSAGKTIAINFFSEIEGLTYASDKFTPASFVSNATNVKKTDLSKIDLLPRLKYKMFLLRDLATLFSKRDDDLNECLGLLTRVLDGEGLNTDSGVHGQRQYVGEYLFMILAGSTPIPPRVWKMMGNLGSRLFFLNINSREKSEGELADQLTTFAYKEKEGMCRTATKNFLHTLWHKYPNGVDWNKELDSREDKLVIARCAGLLAKLRGVINVWKDRWQDGEVYEHTRPVIERPDRINQLFYNLCRGHALVCGRTQINHDDLRLIVELAVDSAPTTRANLFRKIIDSDGAMKTGEVMVALNCSRPTALKEMEELKILGVCNISQDSCGDVGEPEKTINLSEGFKWFLSDECKTIRGIPLPIRQGTMADLL